MSERIEDWKDEIREVLNVSGADGFAVDVDVESVIDIAEKMKDEAVRQLKDELKDVKQAHKQLVELIKKERAERDEAVRRAVEEERERLAMWAHNNPKDAVEGHDMCIDFNELIEALTPPDSDTSSEGNSK